MKVIDLQVEEKVYGQKQLKISILNELNLRVSRGEKVAIVGESGVGKSSLLNILGLIDRDYKGSYELFGQPTKDLKATKLARWRNEKIGFVLQESALIDSLTIEENIKLPLLYDRSPGKEDRQSDFERMVHTLGLGRILAKKPMECSGGERARAVFARGIIMKPALILCDEPTAALDEENREKILALLFQMNEELGSTLITVTHQEQVASRHDRVLSLERRG